MSDGNTRLNQRMFALAIALLLCCAGLVAAQQTTAFTYQGKLTDAGNPASGAYQLQFKLFDVNSTQIGATISDVAVTATAGVFTTTLDFGAAAFPGADRFLEIAVRHNAGEGYTILNPRQQISSSPYSIRTLSAAQADDAQKLDGVTANQYVQTTDARLTDSRAPTAGSTNYVQNTTTQQAGNFNIGGNGFVGGNIGIGTTVPKHHLSINGGPTWTSNAWSGAVELTNGSAIGWQANAGGQRFGIGQSGGGLYFFRTASDPGTTGSPANYDMLISDTGNVGIGTTTSSFSRLEVQAGNNYSGVYGFSNSSIGVAGQSNTGDGVQGVSDHGIGVQGVAGTQGSIALAADGTSWFHSDTTPLNGTVGTGIAIGSVPGIGYIQAFDYGSGAKILALNNSGGNVGINTLTPDQTLSVNGNASKVGAGSWLNYSDERLKNIKGRFTTGLNAVMQLQPIRYQYKPENALKLQTNGEEYVGFGAQAVQKVIPEAVTKDSQGYLLVNNDPIMWTMLNAIKEQQGQIEALRSQNSALKARLRGVEKSLRKRVGSARRRR